MAKFFGSTELEITCGKCGRKTKRRVSTLEHNPNLTCPHCGTITKVDASQFRQTMRSVDKALDDFKRKFGK